MLILIKCRGTPRIGDPPTQHNKVMHYACVTEDINGGVCNPKKWVDDKREIFAHLVQVSSSRWTGHPGQTSSGDALSSSRTTSRGGGGVGLVAEARTGSRVFVKDLVRSQHVVN